MVYFSGPQCSAGPSRVLDTGSSSFSGPRLVDCTITPTPPHGIPLLLLHLRPNFSSVPLSTAALLLASLETKYPLQLSSPVYRYNTSQVLVDYGHSLIINPSLGCGSGLRPFYEFIATPERYVSLIKSLRHLSQLLCGYTWLWLISAPGGKCTSKPSSELHQGQYNLEYRSISSNEI